MKSIKVKGFLQDVGGASRVTKMRAETIRHLLAPRDRNRLVPLIRNFALTVQLMQLGLLRLTWLAPKLRMV